MLASLKLFLSPKQKQWIQLQTGLMQETKSFGSFGTDPGSGRAAVKSHEPAFSQTPTAEVWVVLIVFREPVVGWGEREKRKHSGCWVQYCVSHYTGNTWKEPWQCLLMVSYMAEPTNPYSTDCVSEKQPWQFCLGKCVGDPHQGWGGRVSQC